MENSLIRFKKGIIDENPIFAQAIALCPVLAVTTTIINGIGLGLATLAVMASSCLAVSLLRNFIPSGVRIPIFIVISATFTTVVRLVLEAYFPALNATLGIFIPLIVVNCIILARMEAYAAKQPPIPVLFDALGMGLGFTLALAVIGGIREIIGLGSLFDVQIIPDAVPRMILFILPPGGFFILGFLAAGVTLLRKKS